MGITLCAFRPPCWLGDFIPPENGHGALGVWFALGGSEERPAEGYPGVTCFIPARVAESRRDFGLKIAKKFPARSQP